VGAVIKGEAGSAFREFIESGKSSELQDETDKIGGYPMLMFPAVDYLQAMRLRTKMKKAMADTYAPYDALISPTWESVAPPIRKGAGLSYPGLGCPAMGSIPAGNLVGQPALTVPNGFGDQGMPTALQFSGGVWSEEVLLHLAQEYQSRTDFHRKAPKLDG
jgi:aspartyl-tRNA(Asn)/glutamyl-tRNA(Gln) amidotransferase subunit A